MWMKQYRKTLITNFAASPKDILSEAIAWIDCLLFFLRGGGGLWIGGWVIICIVSISGAKSFKNAFLDKQQTTDN